MHITPPDAPDSREALCQYRTLASEGGMSWVMLMPETGRMHQLRLQMASHGCPVLGDGKYGGSLAHPKGRATLHLHAYGLEFQHPHTGQDLSFTVPLPAHIEGSLQQYGVPSVLPLPKGAEDHQHKGKKFKPA